MSDSAPEWMQDPAIARLLALDARLVEAVRPVRLMSAVSWPAHLQTEFIASCEHGNPRPPSVEYTRADFSDVRGELAAIHRAAQGEHPLAEYLRRTTDSWLAAAELIEALGTPGVTGPSVRLFGRPGDRLPGSDLSNLDAARHFISLADELAGGTSISDAEYCLSAEVMQGELQMALDGFFHSHRIRVEIDDELIAKAAAGHTRIRLRGATCFSEYDRHQLLEHEAFVHSLTALNGREQPHLKSLGRSAPRVTATQEGLATFAELITGAIDIGRLKRISLRIIAIDMVLEGADFLQVFEFFRASGQTAADSFASAQRVFRGCPLSGGAAFTKDTVYLHGLLGVHTFFRWCFKHRRLNLIRLLFAGKMALHDVFTLEPLFEQGVIAEPLYLPPWVQRARGLAGTLAFSLFANRIHLDKVAAEDLVRGL